MMEEQTYLDTFEARVKSAILLPVEDLEEDFILTDDITAQWERIEQEYIADAVIQIRDYPEVSVAWASYIGMAVAEGWDKDWDTISKTPYTAFYGEQGFDDMDDHIITHYLGLSLDCETTKKYVSLFQTCAKIATNCIRREQIPPQSPLAYHCFVRICKLMFALGASIRLKHLGYSLQKIDL